MEAIKLTGDPFVPARKITFFADLGNPVGPLERTDFKPPADLIPDDPEFLFPNSCQGRFVAEVSVDR